MRVPRPSRSFKVARRPMSSGRRPAWRILVGWSARIPVGYGSTGSSGRQPELRAGVRGRTTASGPGGGAAVVGALVAPPPLFSPVEPTAAQTTDSRELSERRVDAGHSARLRALIAALSGPDREIIESRVVTGVSIPDIVAILGVTPGEVGLAQHQALGALRPAATANGPPPARKRVVLLPHARTEPTDTRPNNRRTGRGPGVNQDDAPRRHPAQGDDATGAIATSGQWHDAELAMKVARHSFESWLVAGHEDAPSLALRHACHTHTALHEAARAIAALIETFRVEAAALITSPAHDTDIPAQRR
jgi:hypothetical protein